MANSLFKYKDVHNTVHRAGFDLSFKNAFTAKTGEMLPIHWQFVYPNDHFDIGVQWFTRTQPVNTAAYTRVREYFDWFFVPMHLLWKSFDTVITQMTDNPVQATSITSNAQLSNELPYFSSIYDFRYLMGRIAGSTSPVNQFGFTRVDLSEKLLEYLDYGNSSNDDSIFGTSLESSSTYTQRCLFPLSVNPFPLFAYHKIYQDYVRNSQWEKAKPYLWNVDYSSGGLLEIPPVNDSYYNDETILDLHYWNWNKDLFMGVLPNTQYGDVATIKNNYGTTNPVTLGVVNSTTDNVTFNPLSVGSHPSTAPISDHFIKAADDSSIALGDSLVVRGQLASSFNVLQLRMAECLQRWKEIAQSGSQDYRNQIKKHFGIEVPEGMSNMCEYLGGQAGSLDISEVLNNNITGSEQANIAGKGSGSGQGNSFRRRFNDYGILMGIYHNVPLMDYVITGQKKELLYTQATDFAIPELDSVGMEAVPMVTFQNSYLLNWSDSGALIGLNAALGYAPRYWELKTNVDRIHGAFTTTLLDWVAPIGQKYMKDWLSSLQSGSRDIVATYKMFKVNPSLLNSIFTVAADSKWDSDQFLINAQINIKAVRPFDYDGLPY